MNKPFSRQLYADNDSFAKEVACDFLTSTYGAEIIPDTQERYKDWDFKFTRLQKEYAVEAERKVVWKKSGEWQGWPTVDIPYRKKDSKSDYFVMVNEPGDTLLIIHMSKVVNSQVKVKDTIYTKGEKFFSVPVGEFTMFVREDGKWV